MPPPIPNQAPIDRRSQPNDPLGIIGETVGGHYVVEELVGEGGLTLIYKARCDSLDARVAIKCLNLPATLDPALLTSVVRNFHEARQVHYRLSQGNVHIARSFAGGTTWSPILGADVPYLVREWFVGRSLAADFARRRLHGMQGRRLTDVIALFESAATALAYAHGHGVVHHHINPGNLFLATNMDGTALKVLDFGVAKVEREISGQFRIFDPTYAAPEQLDKGVGPVGPWTDVCALALVILEALCDAPVVTPGASRRPTPQSLGLALPPEVDELLTRAVARDPKVRPRDVAELWMDLKGAARRAHTPPARSSIRPSTKPAPFEDPDLGSLPKSWPSLIMAPLDERPEPAMPPLPPTMPPLPKEVAAQPCETAPPPPPSVAPVPFKIPREGKPAYLLDEVYPEPPPFQSLRRRRAKAILGLAVAIALASGGVALLSRLPARPAPVVSQLPQ